MGKRMRERESATRIAFTTITPMVKLNGCGACVPVVNRFDRFRGKLKIVTDAVLFVRMVVSQS